MRLCKLSFDGDIRIWFKLENPNKIRNLVKGSESLYYELYKEAIQFLKVEQIIIFEEDQQYIEVKIDRF